MKNMFFIKFKHWTSYRNFLLSMSPPFLGYSISQPDQYGSPALLGFAYFIIAIIIPLTNKAIGLDDEVKKLKEELKQYRPEDTDKKDKDSDPA